MSKALDRIWTEVREGRISEVGEFILEFIESYGCGDPEIEDMVHHYFERLNEE